jgi:hypothetical protein
VGRGKYQLGLDLDHLSKHPYGPAFLPYEIHAFDFFLGVFLFGFFRVRVFSG